MTAPRHDLHERDWRTIRRLAESILEQCAHHARIHATGSDDRARAFLLRDRELSAAAGRLRRRFDRERAADG